MGTYSHEIRCYPEDPVYEIDKLDQRKQYYIGFWKGSVTLPDGSLREYLTYCPSTAKRDARNCHMALPGGVDPAEFLDRNGWLDLAEKEEVVLSVFLPENGVWKSPEEELPYFSKVFSSLRFYTPYASFDWRWCGYGDGGACMQRHIMSDPTNCAAAVIIDGSECFTAEELAANGARHHMTRKGALEETLDMTPVPVWLIEKEITPRTQVVIDYWKKANDVLPQPLELADGSIEYHQDPYSQAVETYDHMVGIVRCTPKDLGDYRDPAMAAEIYAFLTRYSRNGQGSPYSNALSAAPTPSVYQGLEYQTQIVDGYQREWYIYFPPKYDPQGPKLPLVFYFHGTHQSGLVSFRQSDWWKVAQRHNFIVIMPSGSLENKRMPKKVPGMSWNLEDYGNADDIVFVRFLVDYMIRNYQVDPGRIYANGQSNGGRMTLYCALALPELFAAAASMGASTLGDIYNSKERYLTPPDTNEAYDIPVMSTIGENDMFNYDLTDPEGTCTHRCRYFCERYGMDYEKDHYHYENGRYVNDIWIDDQKVPMLRQTISLKRAHNFNPRETEMTWNEWFALFARDPETKKVIYMGRVRD